MDAIEKLVHELDAPFFDERPELLFGLRRCRFMQLLASGSTAQALLYARGELSPMAGKHPSLEPMLKVGARWQDLVQAYEYMLWSDID